MVQQRTREIDFDYVGEVYKKITDNPSASEFDFFLEARAVVGNYVATAESSYDLEKANRQYLQAQATLAVKQDYPKFTQQQVEAEVLVRTQEVVLKELKRKAELAKLKSVLESTTEVINGIKFLGRFGGS